jgi:hypothetical protein
MGSGLQYSLAHNIGSNLMQINLNKGNKFQTKEGKIPQGSTVISPNLVKSRVILDSRGNEVSSIDPRKAVIVKHKGDE